MIRILIADDHGVLRAGLRALVDTQDDMEVVGEASDGEGAVQLAQKLIPDVVVLDLEMPGMGGVEAIGKVHEVSPDARVLVLTMHDDQRFVRAVMAAGGAGYVVKEALGSELVSAVRAVHQGRSYLNVSLDSGSLKNGTAPSADSVADVLSAREKQVLELVAQGFTNQEIGKQLHLSPGTVGTYRYRLGEKLGLRTRAEIVRYALESGLLAGSKSP